MDPGTLVVPPRARAIVLFAHGSGSSRFSPRNRFVAETLNRAGFATLLFDLLTPEEDADQARRRRFDIALLAERLIAMTDRVADDPATANLRIAYFGASTGAAAALVAAAERPALVGAIVTEHVIGPGRPRGAPVGGAPAFSRHPEWTCCPLGSARSRRSRAPTLALRVGRATTTVIALTRHVGCILVGWSWRRAS